MFEQGPNGSPKGLIKTIGISGLKKVMKKQQVLLDMIQKNDSYIGNFYEK